MKEIVGRKVTYIILKMSNHIWSNIRHLNIKSILFPMLTSIQKIQYIGHRVLMSIDYNYIHYMIPSRYLISNPTTPQNEIVVSTPHVVNIIIIFIIIINIINIIINIIIIIIIIIIIYYHYYYYY